MKTNCPHCDSSIIIDGNDTVYDEQRYSGQCPSCKTHFIAIASVSIEYDLVVAEVDADGPVEYCDDSVDVRTDHTANHARVRAAWELLRCYGAEMDPKFIEDYAARYGLPL